MGAYSIPALSKANTAKRPLQLSAYGGWGAVAQAGKQDGDESAPSAGSSGPMFKNIPILNFKTTIQPTKTQAKQAKSEGLAQPKAPSEGKNTTIRGNADLTARGETRKKKTEPFSWFSLGGGRKQSLAG